MPAKKRKKGLLITGMVVAVVLALVALPLINKIQQYFYPRHYQQEVQHWAEEFEVETNFVYAVIRTESGFKPQAQSDVGARGLMQMTEETFDWLKQKLVPEEDLTFDDLYKPAVSIRFGVYYLSLCLQRYNQDMATAAAAYHSGWGTVDALLEKTEHTDDGKTLADFPYSQMANYVHKVLTAYEKYTKLYT